jgi:hypothetical protein
VDARYSRSELWIRLTTTASVLLVAAIAAVVSYRHMHGLVLEHGEDGWAAALIPVVGGRDDHKSNRLDLWIKNF